MRGLMKSVERDFRPETLSHGDFVRIRGAREHNLKNVSVDIPGTVVWH